MTKKRLRNAITHYTSNQTLVWCLSKTDCYDYFVCLTIGKV